MEVSPEASFADPVIFFIAFRSRSVDLVLNKPDPDPYGPKILDPGNQKIPDPAGPKILDPGDHKILDPSDLKIPDSTRFGSRSYLICFSKKNTA